MGAPVRLVVNGRPVDLRPGGSLLEALRDQLGLLAAKDGCSPQGQCGCCTVWVDGRARVACVTPLERVEGRSVTTLEGLAPEVVDAWAGAFTAAGASQCGFCSPGIVMRLAALGDGLPGGLSREAVWSSLRAHLCRCTGWQSIVEAATGEAPSVSSGLSDGERLMRASRQATLEGGTSQRVGPDVTTGGGGFADDLAPRDALVAVPAPDGDWSVAGSLHEARAGAGKVQGRRASAPLAWPVPEPEVPGGRVLQTTWVEPAYVETDASWCVPGGSPAAPLANGGAFGAKEASPLPAVAAELARALDAPVRALWAREDVTRLGPKRPPLAMALRSDGTGTVRVGWSRASRLPAGPLVGAEPTIEEVFSAVAVVAPGVDLEVVEVEGPPTSLRLRAAVWLEVAAARGAIDAAARGSSVVRARSPEGAWAEAELSGGRLRIVVQAGEVLDEVVLRSYAIGAAHQALGMVWSEGLGIAASGEPADLTLRSFGILRAEQMPAVEVEIAPGGGAPLRGSDAVAAAVAGAAWLAEGLPRRWPTRR
jgi:xanthine dehydrogenase small subunit